MKDYAKQPQPVTRTIESNPKATHQASISDILQRNKKSTIRSAVQMKEGAVIQGVWVTVSTSGKRLNLKNNQDGTYTDSSTGNEYKYFFQIDNTIYVSLITTTPPPSVATPTNEQLQHAHRLRQDLRYYQLNTPSAGQIPRSAPGAHQIPEEMMPPPGANQQWVQTETAGNKQYRLFTNNAYPTVESVSLTYGDPSAPSLVVNQSGQNLGMHINPASSQFNEPVTRSTSTYGNLPSEPGRVRGHAFALEQNQKSTDDPSVTFDNDARTYTSESNSTGANGGISSWRFNQVERPAISSGRGFTQINNNPTIGAMGIAQPETIDFRISTEGGGYDDLHLDNTGKTNYRDTPKGERTQAHQTEMARTAANQHPFQAPSVRHSGDPYQPKERHLYPGYTSPPSSPEIARNTRTVRLSENYQEGDIINYNDRQWRILRVGRDTEGYTVYELYPV